VTSKRRESRGRAPIPSYLSSSRYFFFGGKGGVGKTTTACATALLLLDHANSNENILIFSTDPAHSLSDSLGKTVGSNLVQVKRHGGAKLFAFEMDSKAALEDFRRKHGKVLAEIANRGTLLDEADINELLNLSLPGLDEVMALFELSELDRSTSYSHVIIDTAPSGHTSRLLRLPAVFSRMVNALDKMADKHRYMVAHFARIRIKDEVDQFLQDLNERIERVSHLLSDSENTSFVLVTIPEAMAVKETERYRESLETQGIAVTDLIINRVEEQHDDCTFCRARVLTQRPWLKELSKTFKNLRQHRVPLNSSEIRGIETLGKVGEVIWNATTKSLPNKSNKRLGNTRAESRPANGFVLGERKIWIFGGKGGVGKTSAAAACALALAKRDSHKKVLIFSTDPAHSLSDSFNEKIGPLKKYVTGIGNLDAMEIDPAQWFGELKQRYRTWTDDLFNSLAGNSRLEIKFDREAMRELVELTPPGIDEIAALGVISDLIDENRYDSIVLDTAPTGHLIRFLELPEIALAWVRTFIKLLLKYQNVIHAGSVAQELVSLSKSIKRVLALLTDPKLCEFVGVAIPEVMSLEETTDLVTSLNRLKVPMQKLLINGIVPDKAADGCRFCKSRLMAQRSILKKYRDNFGTTIELYIAPQREQEIRGAALLSQHFEGWHLLTNTSRTDVMSRSKITAVKTLAKTKQASERKRTNKVASK